MTKWSLLSCSQVDIRTRRAALSAREGASLDRWWQRRLLKSSRVEQHSGACSFLFLFIYVKQATWCPLLNVLSGSFGFKYSIFGGLLTVPTLFWAVQVLPPLSLLDSLTPLPVKIDTNKGTKPVYYTFITFSKCICIALAAPRSGWYNTGQLFCPLLYCSMSRVFFPPKNRLLSGCNQYFAFLLETLTSFQPLGVRSILLTISCFINVTAGSKH